MVEVAEIVSVPLPATLPPDHVIVVAPVTLTLALPFSVPPCIASVGIDCAAALLIVKVPPPTVRFVEIVPANVAVPLYTVSVPAPVMLEAASKVRASLELNSRVVPPATVNVPPLLAAEALR